MKELKALKIGNLTIKKPIIQGGMGVGISLSSLAGTVARAGGLGIISTAQIGYRDPDFKKNPHKANLRAIFSEMKKARELAAGGAVGFNIMVATKEYRDYVKTAVRAGTDIIISGAGLPTALPEYVREAEEEMAAEGLLDPGCDGQCFEEAAREVPEHGPEAGPDPGSKDAVNAVTEEASAGKGAAAKPHSKRAAAGYSSLRTKLAPIVSSLKSASVICRYWEKKYHIVPDMVVIEGPLAGGHLGFTRDSLMKLGADTGEVEKTFKREEYNNEIVSIIDYVRKLGDKYGKEIPVAVAGGVYTHEDVMEQMELGADAVQVATRFVTTKECDAPMDFKQSYIDAKEEDIMIVKSPVGMPGRAIRNKFIDRASGERIVPRKCFSCLTPCNPASTPYCITEALINAAEGNMDNALVFCGSNAWRADRIETVDEVMDDLLGA